jgi:hypothetical protein
MIRLIVSDIDGTLVPEGSTDLNPEYIEVIRALRKKGIEFAAASGRPASSIDVVFHELRDSIYYLGDNGAYIQRYGKPAHEVRIRPEEVQELLNDVRKIPNCYPLLSRIDGYYTDAPDTDFHHLVYEEYKGAGAVLEDVSVCVGDCIKFSIYCKEDPHDVYDVLSGKWKDRLAINISGEHWIDLNDFASGKGEGVRWIQEELGITPEETMVFGDNFNDISMLQQAVHSYASVLSHPDVKKAARYEVASYEEHGVLQILKKLLGEADA